MVDTLPIKIQEELDFLRWFYVHVDDSMGPSSGDIYYNLREKYEEKTGKKAPKIKKIR